MADKCYGMMQQFKNLLPVPQTDGHKLDVLLGKLEVDACGVCLDKKKRTHQTLEEVFLDHFQVVIHELELQGLSPPAEWSVVPSGRVEPKKMTAEPTVVVERHYNDAGKCTNMLQILALKGFTTGKLVQRRADELLATIVSFHDEEVCIELKESLERKFISLASFVDDQWKPFTPPKEQEEVPWQSESPLQSLDFKISWVKCKVVEAMTSQVSSKKASDALSALMLFKGPRDVTSNKEWGVGKLQIPCASCKVVVVPRGKAASSDLIIGYWESFDVALGPTTKIPKPDDAPHSGFINPFYLVGKVDDPDEANLEEWGCKTVVCWTCSLSISKP